jgi:hypothetical protein
MVIIARIGAESGGMGRCVERGQTAASMHCVTERLESRRHWRILFLAVHHRSHAPVGYPASRACTR